MENGPGAIEDQIISLPSNGNIGNDYQDLELTHQVSNADNHLNKLQDLIAEKSFQYSHVIHVAPQKAVTTRSRDVIKKLNHQIARHCQMYSRCQSCLVSLGAEHSIFSRLKVLMLRLQTIKAIIDSCSFKSPKSDEPRRVQVLDLYCLTRLESESLGREDVY